MKTAGDISFKISALSFTGKTGADGWFASQQTTILSLMLRQILQMLDNSPRNPATLRDASMRKATAAQPIADSYHD